MKKSETIVVIGSGGHSRSVVSLLMNNGFAIEGIYDDSFTGKKKEKILSSEIKGKIKDIPARSRIVLATGNNQLREKQFTIYGKKIWDKNIIHPAACIELSARLGNSNLVFAFAYINAMAVVGDNTIINSGCIIEHEAKIGNHCHISVGAVICGRVKIGNSCFIGAGAVIKDGVSVCSGVTIGAGAVVVKNITKPGVYTGVPAGRLK